MSNPVWWIADQVKSIARIERACEGKAAHELVRLPLGDSRHEPASDHLARADKMRENIAKAVEEYGQLAIDALKAAGYEWPQPVTEADELKSITATIIPVTDSAGNTRHVYMRGEATNANTASLSRFMRKHSLCCYYDWHSMQEPSFTESLDEARAFGITSDDYRRGQGSNNIKGA